MPHDPRSARHARRRRRSVSAVGILDQLECRELLATAAASSALAPLIGHVEAHRLATHAHATTDPVRSAAATVRTTPHLAATTHHARTTAPGLAAGFERYLAGFHIIPHKVSQAITPTPSAGGLGNDGAGTTSAGNPPLAVTYLPVPGAYTPTQVRTAYGVNSLPITNQGQGQTIAIIDEFDDPNITSDANVFSSYYNLPQFNTGSGPTLTVYQDTTFGAVASAKGTGVGGETSLDVEWAHALAPQANILLVEVPYNSNLGTAFAELLHGVQYAAAQPNVGAVSLSYGYTESGIGSGNVTSLDNTYLATGSATKTVVTVSSGDSTYPGYPATSPNVVAVGGTSLYLASAKGRYSFETAWGGLSGAGAGGGGLSTVFSNPTFQSTHGVTYANRAVPDLAMIADPVTGVSYYDSLDVTRRNPSPWGEVGGTSLAAPVFAGIVSLAQQNRATAGLAPLTSAQLNNEIYTLYNSPLYTTEFHDITLGNNNDVGSGYTYYNATTGYDLATGVGSPIANVLVPLLSTLNPS